MRTLIVKLKSAVRPEEGCARVRSLVGAGHLESVGQLFPGDVEPDTASLLEVRLRDSAPVEKVLTSLKRADDVEYAHEPSARKPMPRRGGT